MYTTKKGTNELKFIAVTDIYSVAFSGQILHDAVTLHSSSNNKIWAL